MTISAADSTSAFHDYPLDHEPIRHTTGWLTSTRVATTSAIANGAFFLLNYDQTEFGYDDQGRRNRVQAPGGTITRTVYSTRGQVASVWVGTDDTPDSGTWSPTNTGGTNLVEVT